MVIRELKSVISVIFSKFNISLLFMVIYQRVLSYKIVRGPFSFGPNIKGLLFGPSKKQLLEYRREREPLPQNHQILAPKSKFFY